MELKNQQTPLEDAKVKTIERDSILQKGDPEVGENIEDTSIISRLIEKIAAHSDKFSTPPQIGDDTSETIKKGINDGKEQSKKQKEDSLKESEKQRSIIEEAISVRTQKQQEVDQNITDLQAKHEAEKSILQEIRVEKAQRLSQREAARSEVEAHAQTFNVGVEQIQTWSSEYKSRRVESSWKPYRTKSSLS